MKLNFREIPGFSNLFCDFIDKKTFFEHRFPFNNGLFSDKNELITRAENFKSRESLQSAILKSMENIDKSDLQFDNLEKIKSPKSLCCVTGQQVGFLGGPLYTILKAFSTINLAKKLEKIHNDLSFIPIFWVEDNDHDNFEASFINFLTQTSEIETISCSSFCDKNDRRIVASRKFDNEINAIITNLITKFSDTNNKQEISNSLTKIYTPDKNWNTAFIEILNSWMSQFGILFLSASTVRKLGLFQDLSLKELKGRGKTYNLIQQANDKLISAGYHIQAKSSDINLFFHKGNKRLKIETLSNKSDVFQINENEYSIQEMIEILQDNPSIFSPNVLLRPVFQDAVVPTAAYIAGPSEIGYIAQCREVYEDFGVKMPAIIQRHSATIINSKTNKFLINEQKNIEYFFQKLVDIENNITQQLTDDSIIWSFKETSQELDNMIEKLNEESSQIDSTLEGAVSATRQKIIQNLENLEKKVRSAVKRKNEIIFKRYKQASTYIYPNGNLQERYFTPLIFINEFGKDEFINIIDKFTSEDSDFHHIITFDKNTDNYNNHVKNSLKN